MACDEGFEDQDTIGIVTDIGFNYYGYAIYIGISSGRRSTDQDIDYGCVKDDSCVLLERDFRW